MKIRDFFVLLILIFAIFAIYNKNMEELNDSTVNEADNSAQKVYEPVKYNLNT